MSRGLHILYAELVNNDHTPLDPPVVASVTVEARLQPQVEILEPPPGGNIAGSDVIVVITAANTRDYQFIYYLDAAPPNTPGESAITGPRTYAVSTETSYLWQGVTPGVHIFAVQVVNADFATLDPPVTASVSVNTGGGPTTPAPPPQSFFFGPEGIDIVDMAVDFNGTILVAARADATNKLIYKSTNNGSSWTDLSQSPGLEIGSTDFIAIAPDDPDIIAVADMNTPAVNVSTDGGKNWSSLGTIASSGGTAARIYDLDVSSLTSGFHYVALAAARRTGDFNVPSLFYFDLGAPIPMWRDAVRDFAARGGTNLTVGEIDAFKAVRFSPSFSSDRTLLAFSEQIGSPTEIGALRLHAVNMFGFKWDTDAGFTGYPVTLASSSGIAFSVGRVSVSPDPDYNALEDGQRMVFVGARISDNTNLRELGGIYRLEDTTVAKILDAAIHSIAYNGEILVAGATEGVGTPGNAVYYTLEPMVTDPAFDVTPFLKRPSGQDVVVAWVDIYIIAGTSGGGSAFSISLNSGLSFNTISLIDP